MNETQTILLVEPDEALREAIGEMLGGLGFEVRTVNSGRTALQWLDEGEGGIDLVLTEIILPNMSGMELYRIIQDRDHRPDVILMAAYYPAPETLRSLNLQEVVWLEKPFTTEDFKRASGRVGKRD